MPDHVAVLGAGAWGTALAIMLARRGHHAALCVRRQDHRARIRAVRENSAYLPGVKFPEPLEVAEDIAGAIRHAKFVVLAVPSRYARSALKPVADAIARDALIVSATKGIEEETLLTMSQLVAEVAPHAGSCAVLAGPGFAAEVARGKPAALVAASSDGAVAKRVQTLFSAPTLRVYSSRDVAGVEICGAAKNVIAIAAGISDGLNLGASARAAVITRGLAEIMRLVTAAGGRSETAAGLAGLGDLVLTCTGDLSRNRAAGLALARGETLRLAKSIKPIRTRSEPDAQPVAEGVTSARPIHAITARLGVEMPIVAAVVRALYEGEAPQAMVDKLLNRELKAEF